MAVVEEANFTRAAQRCHVAQPGVSAQIRQLERELGQVLLDRSGRTVRPTGKAGAAVLPYARAALEAVAGIRLAVHELSGLVRGHLAVGMVASVSSIDLPAVLAGFAQRHPGVEITLTGRRLGQPAQRSGRPPAGRVLCRLARSGASRYRGRGRRGCAPRRRGRSGRPAPRPAVLHSRSTRPAAADHPSPGHGLAHGHRPRVRRPAPASSRGSHSRRATRTSSLTWPGEGSAWPS